MHIKEMMSWVENHLTEPLTLKEIAASVHPLSTGMSADFQSVSAPDADGISAVETDSRSGRQSAEHKRILPLSFLGTDGIIIS